MLILGGGRSTLNLERICEDFGRITSDNGKDPQWPRKDRLNWKGSAMTLEGSPQLGKDPQWPWKDCLNLERIRNDFGRIASANADPWGGGSIDTQLGKDHLWQCWSWGVKRILPKSLRILSKLRWSFQGLCRSFPSWGDPSKVFADPFQVECQSTPHPPQDQHCQRWSFQVFADPFQVECRLTPPQDQHCQRWSFQSLHGSFPSKLSVDRTPQDQHCQRWSFQSLRRSFPKWSVDWPPPQDQHCQMWSFQSLRRSFPSWVSIDPPSPPLPPHLRNDNFQVECRSTPPLRVVSIWGRSTVFEQNSSHSTATKTSLCGKIPVDSDLHISLFLCNILQNRTSLLRHWIFIILLPAIHVSKYHSCTETP